MRLVGMGRTHGFQLFVDNRFRFLDVAVNGKRKLV